MYNLGPVSRCSWDQSLKAPRPVRQQNTVISPVGLGTKNHCAGEASVTIFRPASPNFAHSGQFLLVPESNELAPYPYTCSYMYRCFTTSRSSIKTAAVAMETNVSDTNSHLSHFRTRSPSFPLAESAEWRATNYLRGSGPGRPANWLNQWAR
jgi:hypothetical protein